MIINYFFPEKIPAMPQTHSKSRPHPSYVNPAAFKKVRKEDPPLTGSTVYLSLTNEDAIYLDNLNRLKSHDFQQIIRKMLMDFNLLLHFNYDDFWNEIKGSQTLKFSLSSCLQIFTKKKFNKHIQKEEQGSVEEVLRDENFKVWKQLVKVVLFLYHRIICDSRETEKDYIYDNWYFDVPKMFDLIDIYGNSCPEIVKEIIFTALETIPQYRDDITTFVNLIHDQVLDEVEKSLSFDYKKEGMKGNLNYENSEASCIQGFMNRMQSVYDCYDSLYNYMEFFPSYPKQLLVTDFQIHHELFHYYFLLIERTKNWEGYRGALRPFIEAIRQKCIRLLIRSFLQLRDLMVTPMTHELWGNGVSTYYFLCKRLLKNIDKNNQEWKYLFKWIVDKSICQNIFIMTPEMKQKLKNNKNKQKTTQKQIQQTMARCQQFEKVIKQEINSQIQKDLRNIDDLIHLSTVPFYQPNMQDLFPSQKMCDIIQNGQPPIKQKIGEYDDQPEEEPIASITAIGIGYETQQACFVPQKGENNIERNKKRIDADTSISMNQDSKKSIKYNLDLSMESRSPETSNTGLKNYSFEKQQIDSSMEWEAPDYDLSYESSLMVKLKKKMSFSDPLNNDIPHQDAPISVSFLESEIEEREQSRFTKKISQQQSLDEIQQLMSSLNCPVGCDAQEDSQIAVASQLNKSAIVNPVKQSQ